MTEQEPGMTFAELDGIRKTAEHELDAAQAWYEVFEDLTSGERRRAYNRCARRSTLVPVIYWRSRVRSWKRRK